MRASSQTCSDATFDRDSARPTNVVQIATIPENFDDAPALVMTGLEPYDELIIPVARHPQEGSYFVVPILPSNPVKGGHVDLQLIDSSGKECDAGAFEIEALPSAPGAFKEFADELENLKEATSAAFGIDLEESVEPSTEPVLQPFQTAEDWLTGEDNPNSIEKILDGEAEISPDITEEVEELLDGLIEESDVVEHIQETIEEITELSDDPGDQQQDPPRNPDDPPEVIEDTPTQEPPSTIGDKFCDRIGGDMSAATLARLMSAQGKLEQFRGDTDLILDGVGLLNGLVGTVSLVVTGGIPNPVAAATGVIGVSLSTYDLLTDASIHMLPAEFLELDFDYEKSLYFEDEEDLSGYWDNVLVTARGKEWDMDGRILEQVIGRATGGISKRFISRHGADKAAHAAGEFLTATFSSGAAAIVAQQSTGLLSIPPCDFGPVDISDLEFHQAELFLPGRPAIIVDEREFEVVDTGEARLVIRPRAEKFGGKTMMRAKPVEAAPIEITIDPPAADGDPGFTAIFTVTVENAHDTGINVSVEPSGGHEISVDQTASNTYEITVSTSIDREDFPALLRVESTADSGLRAKPDAPPRFETARIGSDGDISLTPRAVCVEPGEKFQFEAEVHDFDNKNIVWESTDGAISSSGLFTAPEEPVIVEVRAAAAADRARSAVSKVTVAESCTCWASLELPLRGIHEVASVGDIHFGEGAREGQLQNLRFAMENGAEVNTEFFNVLRSDYEIPKDFPDRGPRAGDSGRYLVDMREGGLEPTGNMVDFRSNLHLARPLGGIHYSTELGSGELEPTYSQSHASVDEFSRDGDSYWLQGRVTGEVMVHDEGHHWRLEPVRMYFQGEFMRSSEGLFPRLDGTIFEPWQCGRN